MTVLLARPSAPVFSDVCRFSFRGDFAELHARSGILTLDLDEEVLVLTRNPHPMRRVAEAFAEMLASDFARSRATGSRVILIPEIDFCLELVQMDCHVAIYPEGNPETQIVVPIDRLREGMTRFLRVWRG
jgi:hypothetical protein